jgi:hypothetical protein
VNRVQVKLGVEIRSGASLNAMDRPKDLLFYGRQFQSISGFPPRMRPGKRDMIRRVPIRGGNNFTPSLRKMICQPIERFHNLIPSGNRQSAGRTKIILHVNYNERGCDAVKFHKLNCIIFRIIKKEKRIQTDLPKNIKKIEKIKKIPLPNGWNGYARIFTTFPRLGSVNTPALSKSLAKASP